MLEVARRLLCSTAAALALASGAAADIASAATTTAPRGPLLGVVPHRGEVSVLAPSSRAAAAAATPTNMTYHGGPVMHTNATYAVYWEPSGYTTPFTPRYKSLVDEFLGAVAADSGRRGNVYAADTQYDDATGHVRYSSTYGGSFPDLTAFPPTTCAGTTKPCLTNGQIQARIGGFVNANNLPRGLGNLYFVLTPPGIVVCSSTTSTACSDSRTGFCAYHSSFGSGASTVLYAVHPFPDPNGCLPGQSPNADVAADAQINLISHEHNETITDPLFSSGAWYDSAGDENADKCAWGFGAALGQTPSGQYNQLINGRPYWLQREWSNLDTGCVQQFADRKPTAGFSASPDPPSPEQAVAFNVTTVNDPDSDVTGYTWDFGDGSGAAGPSASHAYATSGLYTVTLTVHDNDGDTQVAIRALSVGSGAGSNPGPAPTNNGGDANPPAPSLAPAPPAIFQKTLALPTIAFPTIAFPAGQRTVSVTRRGYFSYALSGSPPRAGGRISFGTLTAVAAARKRTRRLSLGSSKFTLSSSGRTTVTLKLARSHLAALKRRRSLSVRATVTIGSVSRTATFLLKAPR